MVCAGPEDAQFTARETEKTAGRIARWLEDVT
jgi:hypothetical protein